VISRVFFHLLYASVTWTVEATDVRTLMCFRRILNVWWKDEIGNETIREKVQRQCGGLDKAKKTQAFRSHLQNGCVAGMVEGSRETLRKTCKAVVGRYRRLMWTLSH